MVEAAAERGGAHLRPDIAEEHCSRFAVEPAVRCYRARPGSCSEQQNMVR